MRDLPTAIIHVLRQFELAFSERVWVWAKVLLVSSSFDGAYFPAFSRN